MADYRGPKPVDSISYRMEYWFCIQCSCQREAALRVGDVAGQYRMTCRLLFRLNWLTIGQSTGSGVTFLDCLQFLNPAWAMLRVMPSGFATLWTWRCACPPNGATSKMAAGGLTKASKGT